MKLELFHAVWCSKLIAFNAVKADVQEQYGHEVVFLVAVQ